jgi:hypothetical protein
MQRSRASTIGWACGIVLLVLLAGAVAGVWEKLYVLLVYIGKWIAYLW